MHSYFSYVNGQDVLEDPGQRWLYCLRASAFLRDVLPSLSLKRDLEMGRRGSEEAGPDVVARVALSSQETLEAALGPPLRPRPRGPRCPSRRACTWVNGSTRRSAGVATNSSRC